ncbi:MAG: hypothetical protein WC250_01510 [Candidatus Paceibacterota bacterium]|jgi:hypothetical protein
MSTPTTFRAHLEIDGHLKNGEIHKALKAIDGFPKPERVAQLLKVLAKVKTYERTGNWKEWVETNLHALAAKFLELGELTKAEEVIAMMSISNKRRGEAEALLKQTVANMQEASRGADQISEE